MKNDLREKNNRNGLALCYHHFKHKIRKLQTFMFHIFRLLNGLICRVAYMHISGSKLGFSSIWASASTGGRGILYGEIGQMSYCMAYTQTWDFVYGCFLSHLRPQFGIANTLQYYTPIITTALILLFTF